MYLKKFYKTLVPYINEAKNLINVNYSYFQNDLFIVKTIMNNPKSYYKTESIENYLVDSLGLGTREDLTFRAINILNSYRFDEVDMLARVLAVYLFQKEHPQLLMTGKPLFFHIGKSVWYGCSLKIKFSNKTFKHYKKREELSFKQLLLIGAVLTSKLQNSIKFINKKV